MKVYVLHWVGGYGTGNSVVLGVYGRHEGASEAMAGYTAQQQRWLMINEFEVQDKE